MSLPYSRKPLHDQPKKSNEALNDSQDTVATVATDSCSDQENSRDEDQYLNRRSVSRASQRRCNNSVKVPPVIQCPSNSNKTYIIYCASIFLLLIILCCSTLYKTNDKTCSFNNFQKNYSAENSNLWNRLQIGIQGVLNNQIKNPAVYLFGHRGNINGLHLIKNIAKHTAGCFGKELIDMGAEDFVSVSEDSDEYGNVIVKFKEKIKIGNVLLILNLNEIPAEIARALHVMCDTYSPISNKIVLFLTLTVDVNKNGNANEIVEETLRDLWESKLEDNELDALITRVTDQVVIIKT